MMKKLFTSFFILVSSFVFSQAPTFQWAKQIGGTSSDAGSSIVADGSGNVYTTGSFQGTVDFDPGAGVFNLTSHAGSSDIFISKLDATGNFIWAKNLGGNSSDYGRSIAIDASGNVYTTGGFQATADFDPGVGTYSLSAIGPADVFISKLDASGNFVWAKSIAADGGLSSSIAIDALGNVLTTGSFQGTVDFDPGLGVFNMTVAGTSFYDDVFINKLNASGTFVWAKRMGGTNYDNCYSISLDGTGNVYTTGYFSGTSDFDPGIGIFNLTSSSSSYDAFVSKLDSSGSFKWAKNMGGTGTVYPRSIVVDASGNVFTTGFFNGTDDFDPGSGIYNLSVTGNSFDLDVYFSKLDAFGTFVWAKSIGSVNSDYAYSISVDAVGNLYTSGAFAGTIDFDPGVGVYNLTSNGFYDIFVNKLDNSGLFMWAKNMGGTTSEYGFSVFSDPVGSVYTTGSFQDTVDFDPGPGIYKLVSNGQEDIFIHKMSQGPTAVHEISLENSITIYPNPTNGQFNLEFNSVKQKTEIKITNSLGQIILQKNISSTDKISLSISDQPSGIYFVEVNADGESYRTKVVKE